MISKFPFILLLFFFFLNAHAQQGVIQGKIVVSGTNNPVFGANIVLDNTNFGAISEADGSYKISNIPPGIYTVICSYVGYSTMYKFEIAVGITKPIILNFSMTEGLNALDEVVLSTPSRNAVVSPLSSRTISATEIARSPGGNRDISKVVQNLPGVASTASFRNDLIVRGGAPSENKFYLDGIEIPNINHFSTQGSSGGPVGMLNVNFIESVNFLTGAFPVEKGNALSSVMDVELISGNPDRLSTSITLGSSDMGLTLDGPTGENSTFLFSFRRSYLQLIFEQLKLPFLPTYNDFQYKHEFFLNENETITLISVGAIDDFELNTEVNEGVSNPDDLKRNQYILGNLPINSQYSYVFGVKYNKFNKRGRSTLVLSHNYLKNKAEKFKDNTEEPNNLLLDYNSSESEFKMRYERRQKTPFGTFLAGTGIEHAKYTNTTFQKKELNGTVATLNYDSSIDFLKYTLFGQWNYSTTNNKFHISVGLRNDWNNYTDYMKNPFHQFSPRLSISYAVTNKLKANFYTGRFHQLPAYTILGFKNNSDVFVNRTNDLRFIRSDQAAFGLEWKLNEHTKSSVEGFYKKYSNYPFSVENQISLANLGADFGVIGTEAVRSTSSGRSYGVEFLYQRKLFNSVYGIASYTFVRSEFQNYNNDYIPSSWDNKHILNVATGIKLNKNWELGLKYRYLHGAPYTPYDLEISSSIDVWDIKQEGVLDWSEINSKRNPNFGTMDIRVDKKWYFKKTALNLYLDVQNIWNATLNSAPYFNVQKDQNGHPLINPDKPTNYIFEFIENESGTILPSIGIQFEF